MVNVAPGVGFKDLATRVGTTLCASPVKNAALAGCVHGLTALKGGGVAAGTAAGPSSAVGISLISFLM